MKWREERWGDYSIRALLVLPAYAAGETRGEEGGDCVVAAGGCKGERGVPVGVAGDAVVFVAGGDEVLDEVEEAELGGEVEGGVAFVGEVRVLQALRVVFDDAFDEDEVVQVDGAAEADADVDPDGGVSLGFWNVRLGDYVHACYIFKCGVSGDVVSTMTVKRNTPSFLTYGRDLR